MHIKKLMYKYVLRFSERLYGNKIIVFTHTKTKQSIVNIYGDTLWDLGIMVYAMNINTFRISVTDLIYS